VQETRLAVYFESANRSVGRVVLQHFDSSSIIKVELGTEVGN